MTHVLRCSAVLLALLALAGCGKKGPETMPETSPDTWVKAFNATDAQALVSVYTDDCIVLPPNAKAGKGKLDVVAAFNYALRQGMRVQVKNEEALVQGDLAYRRGAYEYKDRDGAVVEQGKYLQIWRKFDKGVWLMSRHAWNTDEQPEIKAPTLIN